MSNFDFSHKAALLDNNVIKAFLDGSKDANRFKEVVNFLRDNEAHLYIVKRITEFEFVGFANNKVAYDQLQKWINNFDGLPPQAEDFDIATKLSAMYKCKNPNISPKQISFVDCLYAAHLLRVKDRAFIVTTDLNDYPSFLFDTSKYFPIEESGGNTSFVAIKTFNADKLKELEESFNKSGK